MYLNLKQNKIVATFKFEPKIIGAIRTISGRVWNKELKHWEFDVNNIVEVVNTLKPLGFCVHNDLQALMDQETKRVSDILALKKNSNSYAGTLPLKDFQRIGASFMGQLDGVLLADVPGLGKTIQTIAACEKDSKVLVFVPASLKYSWKDEIEKWEPQSKVLVIDGSKEERKNKWFYATNNNYDYKYIICNYELLLRDFDFMNKIKDEVFNWPTIVCDEATRISNPTAKTTKALKLLKANRRLALTGTPISNSPQDLFSIIDWIQPGYLGTYWQFQETYCVKDDSWGRIVAYKNMDKLADKIEPLILRRTKEEVLKDFPAKTIENIVFDLSDEEKKVYEAIRLFIVEELNKMNIDKTSLPIIPVKMLRLKQTTNHASLVDKNFNSYSTKLETLKDLLKPIIESGEKAIIFTQFSEMLQILSQELRQYNPVVVYGDVHPQKRFEAVQKLKTDADCKIIIMTEAGAYGLNIQHATYVFHYDMPWSIAKLMQREDRSHRIGQGKPVTVYNLIAKNTVDEYVVKVLHKKQKTSVQLLKDFERLEEKGLSIDDINGILRL